VLGIDVTREHLGTRAVGPADKGHELNAISCLVPCHLIDADPEGENGLRGEMDCGKFDAACGMKIQGLAGLFFYAERPQPGITRIVDVRRRARKRDQQVATLEES
jgi:hypothetical protein